MAQDCGSKTVTVAGTAEPLGILPISGRIWIQAFANNTGKIALGCEPNKQINRDHLYRASGPVASVTATQKGFQLDAQQSIEVSGTLSSWWIDATVSGEGVAYLVI